jgi:CheY-like chemotaxis protein
MRQIAHLLRTVAQTLRPSIRAGFNLKVRHVWQDACSNPFAMAHPLEVPETNPHRTTVLCVDDSPDILFICRRFLESRGYEVLTASNGEAALQTLKEHPVDAAITDNEMPGMDGLQLAQEMKHMQNDLPILMFSSARPDFSPSVDCYLEKSYGPLALVKALQGMVPALSEM